MDFNNTSNESNIVNYHTFHIMENVSFDEHSTFVNNRTTRPQMMALYVFLFLIVEIPGNFLLLSMITYEKYGMDSQKRTVTNQLLSSICVSFMIQNIIVVPILMLHRIHHPFLITECKKIFCLGPNENREVLVYDHFTADNSCLKFIINLKEKNCVFLTSN